MPYSAAQLLEANINPKTCLATDYLNHFNEVVMLIEMVPMDNTMLDDIRDYKLVGYQSHFAHSTFKHRDLAIEAYDAVDDELRARFEAVSGQLGAMLKSAIMALEGSCDEETRERIVTEVMPQLREEIGHLAGLINGDEQADDDFLDHQAQPVVDLIFEDRNDLAIV
jgi:hypothetical protein